MLNIFILKVPFMALPKALASSRLDLNTPPPMEALFALHKSTEMIWQPAVEA